MAKEWTVIRTDRVSALPKAEASKKAKTAAKLLNTAKSLDFESLKKEGDKANADNIARENSLLAAAAEGKLKSESLQKEVAAIQKKRDSKKDKKNKG